MSPLRILHLLATPIFSGPAENVLELGSAQRKLGHEVQVAVDRLRGKLGSEETAVPRFRDATLLDEGGLELSTHSSLRNLLRDAGRLRGRSLDVVHAHLSHDHWVARLGRPRGAVLVRSIHAPRSLGWATPAADAFSVPFSALLSRLGSRPARVLPSLVPDRFRPTADREAVRAALGFEGTPLIGMVSTFQPSRHHDVGLRAFAALLRARPEARLVLAGDGALEASLRGLTRSLGLERAVSFAGYRSGDDFIRCLQAFDQVWILGLGNDWSGRAAAQARACGARVVAVPEGALAELADAAVSRPTPDAVVAASLRLEAVSAFVPSLPTPEETARSVLDLYGEARARREAR